MFVQGDFPVTLPKLCVATTFLQRRELFIANIGIRIFGPEQTEDDSALVVADLQEVEEGTIAKQTEAATGTPISEFSYVALHARLILSPLTIAQPGDLRVRALRDGKLSRLGSLRILQAPKT